MQGQPKTYGAAEDSSTDGERKCKSTKREKSKSKSKREIRKSARYINTFKCIIIKTFKSI